MNTPLDITCFDLLQLALDEFKRYDEFAHGGDFDQFASARLVRELVKEAVEVSETECNCGNPSVRYYGPHDPDCVWWERT